MNKEKHTRNCIHICLNDAEFNAVKICADEHGVSTPQLFRDALTAYSGIVFFKRSQK